MSDMVAIVTGASRGIGAATAKLLSNNGFAVCVNYKQNEVAAKQVVDEITHLGGVAKAFQADIAEED